MIKMRIYNAIAGAVASLALSAAVASAESVDGTDVPEDFKLQATSTQQSSLLLGAAFVTLGLGITLDDDNDVRGGVFPREGILSADEIDSFRLEFGWELLRGSLAASSAVASTFGSLAPYFVLGAVVERDDIEYFTTPTGLSPTNGSADFSGVYAGLSLAMLGASPEERIASSVFTAMHWDVFANVGYGMTEVDAFGGAFRRQTDGLFYEIGTALLIDIGRFAIGPAILYRHAGGSSSDARRRETVLELRGKVDLD